MRKSFSVYMHINNANGKRYIGITSGDPLKRWRNGQGYYKNTHFYNAIFRYGWDNFTHLILYTGISKNEACEIEQSLIAKYNTQNKAYGYNLTSGGEFFKHSEESKRLMSQQRMGKGKVKRTPEQIEHMKANHAGGGKKVPVYCVETKKRYECINDAARDTGINKKQISGCCRKQKHYNTAGGFHWLYAV